MEILQILLFCLFIALSVVAGATAKIQNPLFTIIISVFASISLTLFVELLIKK
jgi:hypothetical protein